MFATIITFICTILIVYTQTSTLTTAHSIDVIIPNFAPYISTQNGSCDLHIYTDKKAPTITINITPSSFSYDYLMCTIPLFSRASDTYNNQITCYNKGIKISPQVTYSKIPKKNIDEYTYQEVLDLQIKSDIIPDNLSIFKYTFSSLTSGAISFTRDDESTIFKNFHSYKYESATSRYTIETSINDEYFFVLGKDIKDISCDNTTVEREEITLKDFIDNLTAFNDEISEQEFPISAAENFYRQKLYDYLNNTGILFDYNDLLFSPYSYGFIFYSFIIPFDSSSSAIQIEMPLSTSINSLYNPQIESFSILAHPDTDFSLWIKTNREILNNTAFQKQTDEYKFTGDKTNKFTLSLCQLKNPIYKFTKPATLSLLKISLIVLGSFLFLFCLIVIIFVFKNKSRQTHQK